MKKFGIFLLGVVAGVFIILFVGVMVNSIEETDNPYNISGLSMLSEKGSCIISGNIEVFQTLSKGVALARPTGDYNKFVLLLDNNEKLFYDGEKIKMPAKKCAKQIGVYSYETKAELQKTVPAVVIE